MNLLVCHYDYEAERVLKRLGLEGAWRPAGFYSALTGSRFDRIVVAASSNWFVTEKESEFFEWLPTRLMPGGVIERVLQDSVCVTIG
jgi:hypothetical protein